MRARAIIRHAARRGLVVVLVLLGPCLSQTFAQSEDPAGADSPRYEIVRATENRVWRLDTQTGEIAVCGMRGDRLVCTSSSEAARPEAKSYSDLESEAAARETSDEREQLRLLDKILALLREFIRYALNQERGPQSPDETVGGAGESANGAGS